MSKLIISITTAKPMRVSRYGSTIFSFACHAALAIESASGDARFYLIGVSGILEGLAGGRGGGVGLVGLLDAVDVIDGLAERGDAVVLVDYGGAGIVGSQGVAEASVIFVEE